MKQTNGQRIQWELENPKQEDEMETKHSPTPRRYECPLCKWTSFRTDAEISRMSESPANQHASHLARIAELETALRDAVAPHGEVKSCGCAYGCIHTAEMVRAALANNQGKQP